MKSPIHGLPDGVARLPSKSLRLTLAPLEALALYEALEALTDKLPPTAQALVHLTSISDQLSDKLDFHFPAK